MRHPLTLALCGLTLLAGCAASAGEAPAPVALIQDADNDGVSSDLDCDDTNAAVFPGHAEECDGLDNDCDPTTVIAGAEVDIDGDGAWSCADCDDTDGDRAADCDQFLTSTDKYGAPGALVLSTLPSTQ